MWGLIPNQIQNKVKFLEVSGKESHQICGYNDQQPLLHKIILYEIQIFMGTVFRFSLLCS